MEVLFNYLACFAVGGFVCMIGQILINKTKMTSARILVLFLIFGIVLEAFDLFKPIKEFAGCGITIPISGFGSAIVSGAKEGAKLGLFEAVTFGLANVSAGISAAIFFGFLMAVIFKSHSKKTLFR